MPLGWIDFSKSERNKVLSVLDLLMEQGTLDELGIAPIRDGFANLFFPGTSTIQTRAKYFLIVAYALKDIELDKETNPNRCAKHFNEIERRCGEQFLSAGIDTEGIIGSRSLRQNSWVKRTPADIYWAGLRSYGIARGNVTFNEFVRAICVMKQDEAELLKLGNRNDESEDKDADDKDAGGHHRLQFLNIPTYDPGWIKDLRITLTEDEGSFLKMQIMHSFPDSMLAHILRNNMTEVLDCETFQDLERYMHMFSDEIQRNYRLAIQFSDFLYALRILYNIIVSDGANEDANIEWTMIKNQLNELANVDLELIYKKLDIYRNPMLCKFLNTCQELMKKEDIEGLKAEICKRERFLKHERAKTMHPGEFNPTDWFGGRALGYRFNNARTIVRDIWESESLC